MLEEIQGVPKPRSRIRKANLLQHISCLTPIYSAISVPEEIVDATNHLTGHIFYKSYQLDFGKLSQSQLENYAIMAIDILQPFLVKQLYIMKDGGGSS